MCNSEPLSIPRLLGSEGIRLSRLRGQNFLVDPNLLRRIASFAGGFPTLEIGAGVGNLTIHLAETADRVVAVEIDTRLQPLLRRAVAGLDNVTVVPGDFLECDLDGILGGSETWVCVSNLPYSASSPILFRLLERVDRFSALYLALQEEVAERLAAGPGSKDYGRMTVMAALVVDTAILFRISRKAFFPRPQVESAFVRLQPHGRLQGKILSERVLRDLVRAAFGQRRKKLINALRSAFGDEIGEEGLRDAFGLAGLDPGVRAEAVEAARYVEMANAIAARLESRPATPPD